MNDTIAFSKACVAVGAPERTSVNIMGHNSSEWVISFLGGICGNMISSGVYITNGPEACLYQAENSNASIVVVDSVSNLKKYSSQMHKLNGVKAVVLYSEEQFPAEIKDSRFFLWKDFLTLGKDVPQDIILQKMNN